MLKRTKLWASISAATLLGAASLSGCSTGYEGEGEGEGEGETGHAVKVSSQHYKAGGEGEGEGEGENEGEGEGENEGEGIKEVDLATNQLAYLKQLALIQGHLYVGYQLYLDGHEDHATTHMKHPKSELYADLAPAFKARGAAGFAKELTELAQAVEKTESPELVKTNYEALTKSISAHQSAVTESDELGLQLKLVAELLRVAGEEYAIAVVDGKLENAHEYQDALGFTAIAKELISNGEDETELRKQARDILSSLDYLWPSLIPPQSLDSEAGALYGAAARIELLALSL